MNNVQGHIFAHLARMFYVYVCQNFKRHQKDITLFQIKLPNQVIVRSLSRSLGLHENRAQLFIDASSATLVRIRSAPRTTVFIIAATAPVSGWTAQTPASWKTAKVFIGAHTRRFTALRVGE